ncbi:hypothetical protein [Paenibacillus eucommiae]|uniref:Integrase catalytic domain-containing protein n=1 Tax=Paenibacillus eucommiae TaxID=1355755 RepID=A0ABS4IUE5_9BACL|nr:hypothetical protein [Paenibacillus eucommiae]MBP1991190.1 hypothetical protein [Paenibacillus eucommiae]
MSRQKLIENPNILPEQLHIDLWPSVDTLCLNGFDRKIFDLRKKAMKLYFENALTQKEIHEITGIEPRNLRRLVHRCLALNPNGVIWGFRALIPQKKIKEYTKLKSNKGLNNKAKTGEFTLLLKKYPNIEEKIVSLYLGRLNKEARDPVMRPKNIYRHFINSCKEQAIAMNEYPFNTEDQGYRSLQRYLKKVRDTHFGKASERYGTDSAQKAQNSGIGEQNEPQIIRPYQIVQFDGHRIDAVFAIKLQTLAGDVIWTVTERVWILAFLDVATRNVLGKYISLNKEYTAADVMICARNAIVPKTKLNLTIPGLTYHDTGGYPSEVFKEAEWATWEACSLDNAKSNLSKLVKDRMHNLIRCNTNPGPVAKPMRRPYIERFFQTLEENGFHRSPSTTGSHFKDPRRNEPDKKAIQFYISLEHLEQLSDVLISNYNGMPHYGLDNLSPLQAMEQRLERGMLPKVMSENLRSELSFLQINTSRKISGNIESGKRPHIYYEGVEYRNEILSHAADLIGTKLELHVCVDDIRFLKAYLPDGSEFGMLVATGRWGVVPHSIKMRKEIMKLKRLKIIHFTEHDCPVSIYQEFLVMDSQNNKRSANKYAIVQQAKNKLEKEVEKERHHVMIEQYNQSIMEEVDDSLVLLEQFKTISF